MLDFVGRNLSVVVAPWYVAASCAALVLHAIDKRRARNGGRRIAERTLHLVELLGGWPGAWLAMQVFHHKTQKRSYQLVFALIVAMHVSLLVLWIYWT
ncbi:MAG: DUF1294 domain-containing protein [Phycisphaerales bacterium]|nr:DUF1294 domain-containing protein [Phycisphaerales bacterium]